MYREKQIYFVNKSTTRLVLSIKYHSLGTDGEWRSGSPATWPRPNLATQKIDPGEATFLKTKDKRSIHADRIRLYIWNDRNEVVSDEYWKRDLVLAVRPYQGYGLERFTFNWP